MMDNVTASNMMTGSPTSIDWIVEEHHLWPACRFDPARNDGNHSWQLNQRSPGGGERQHHTTQPGLVWSGTAFSVTAAANYAQYLVDQLWLARAGARKVFFTLRRVTTAGKPFVGLHHLPQPARHDRLHIEREQPRIAADGAANSMPPTSS